MIGKTLAHYKILDKLGEGGMGVVFRAHDSKLDREVAIKVLPKAMSSDPERAARFAREARTLASLQHTNIASVYGYEEADGLRFLVMELIAGEDLSERMARGAVPLDEAIDIATQMAHGLEAAHDQNIVHRDLKPANIKQMPSGEVKILDFGLARAYLGDDTSESSLELSPTITNMMTNVGVILGTAAYMSPEQARGKRIDRRSDMWAFGVILFEMLTGTRLFKGETISDTMAAVLRGDPDFELLPKRTPNGVRRLLRRCLQRDPRQRIRSAGDAILDLGETEEAVDTSDVRSRAPRWLWAALGALLMALVVSLVMRPSAEQSPTATRSLHLDIATPGGWPLGSTSPALSPNGEWLAFTVRDSLDRDVLFLRALARFTNEFAGEVDLRSLTDVGALFWSPDSRKLGIQTSSEILAMDVDTRITEKIIDGMAFARGATWSQDGSMLFAPGSNSGLFEARVSGGAPRQITVIDTTSADASHRWPVFLPDGQRFLFTTWSNAADEQEAIGGIYLGALDGRPVTRLLKDASQVLIDPQGSLLFHRKGKLMQVQFDLDAAEVTSQARVVAHDLHWNPNNGSIVASVSSAGDLVLGSPQLSSQATLGWMSRSGSFESVLDLTGSIFSIKLSRDGRYAAVDRLTVGSSMEIWIADLERSTISLLSRFGSDCWGGAFSPDATRYVYTSQDPGYENLFVHAIDGATDPQLLIDLKSVNSSADDWANEEILLFSHRPRQTGTREIWEYDFATGDSRALLADSFNQSDPVLSPDGRWLAYSSEESGRAEVYIRPYPAMNRKWQVSRQGGTQPHWRADGKELLYRTGPAQFQAVTLAAEGGTLQISNPYPVARFDRTFRSIVPDAQHERFLCGLVDDVHQGKPMRFVSNWRAVLEPAP